MAATVLNRYSRIEARNRSSLRTVIIKQGYLKKIARHGASFRSPQRRWFVFGVMNSTDPYLEYYESEECTFTGHPINIFLLDTCKHVAKTKSARYKHVFTIILADRELTLIADTRSAMDEWCAAISQKLASLGIFVEDDDEHIYVMNPASKPLTLQQRKTLYGNRPVNEISCDRSQSASTPKQCEQRNSATAGSAAAEQEMYEATHTPATPENSYAVPSAERANCKNEGDSIFMQDTSIDPTVVERRQITSDEMEPDLWPATPTSPTSAAWVMFGNSEAQPITACSPMTPRGPDTTSAGSSPPVLFNDDLDLSLLSPKFREASGIGQSFEAPSVVGWNCPPPNDDAPPLYVPHGALECGANRSLKQSQMEELQTEIDNPGGVKIQLKRSDCLYAIAFVDCFKAVWIAGWNQRARPHLHNAFHVGDKVISINGQVIESSRMAMKLIKHCAENSRITFILKRIPNAKLLAMKRNYESENLGIRRNGETPEIIGCDELGPAGVAGLTVRTLTQSGDGFTNWWITEINHRPLSLFAKGSEIEKRLSAVGLDISAVVQPMDFVMELRKKLKGYRNYKDFVVQ